MYAYYLVMLAVVTKVESFQQTGHTNTVFLRLAGRKNKAIYESRLDSDVSFSPEVKPSNQIDNIFSNYEDYAYPLASTNSNEDRFEKVANFAILGLGAYAVTSGMEHMLMQWEWFQDWRYFWPLLGTLYCLEVTVLPGLLPFSITGMQKWWQIATFLSGIGLLVGGAYDAWMPVWATGPNVLTSAGIGQDSAVALLLLSLHALMMDKQINNKQQLLLQMMLLAQLVVLGEGSIDEIATRVSGMLSDI